VTEEWMEAIDEWNVAAGANVFESPGELFNIAVEGSFFVRDWANHERFQTILHCLIEYGSQIEATSRCRKTRTNVVVSKSDCHLSAS
jgi:hypothetical protein